MSRILLTTALVLLAGVPAAAEVCEEPARIGVRDLLVAAPRSPCAGRALAVRLRGAALIDTPDFYGTIDTAMIVSVRWPAGPVELSVDARLLDWRYVQNASVIATELGGGPVAAGVLLPLAIGRVRFAPSLRLVVPFTDTTTGEPVGALEAAVHAAAPVSPSVVLSASAVVHGVLVVPPGGAHGRAAGALSCGVAFAPWRRLRLLAGLEAQVGWYRAGLDHLLARGGVAVVTGRAGRFDLVAAAPLAGDERTDVVAGLDWSLRF